MMTNGKSTDLLPDNRISNALVLPSKELELGCIQLSTRIDLGHS